MRLDLYTSSPVRDGDRGGQEGLRDPAPYAATPRGLPDTMFDPHAYPRQVSHRSRATAGAAPYPAGPSTTAGLLRSLQEENDTLRSQLLRITRERDMLAQQLQAARAAARPPAPPPSAVREGGSGDHAVMVQKLRERCEQLADRLLASVRDQQVTQSAEVYFLLRTQQEERRFLCEGLETMLAELQGESAEGRAGGQGKVDGPRPLAEAAAGEGGGLHVGTVYRLIMAVADAIQEKSAVAKLEKAHARMALEQVTVLLRELQEATVQVTRTLFTTSSTLVDTLEDAQVGVGPGRVPDDDDDDVLQPLSGGRSAVPSVPGGDGGVAGRGPPLPRGGDCPTPLSTTRWDPEALPPHSRLSSTAGGAVHDLEWACDALKACVRGLTDVQRHVEAAAAVLAVAPADGPLRRGLEWGDSSGVSSGARLGPSRARRGVGPAVAAALLPLSLSPEMEGLLAGVLRDVRAMADRSARDRETLTRRLTEELRRHYDTAKQYEQRIRLLEAENSKLAATAAKTFTASTANAAPEPPLARGPTGSGGLGRPVGHAPAPPLNGRPPRQPQEVYETSTPGPAGRRSVTPPERQGQRGGSSRRPLFSRAHGAAGRDESDLLDVSSVDERTDSARDTAPESSPLDQQAPAARATAARPAPQLAGQRRSASLLSPAPRRAGAGDGSGAERRRPPRGAHGPPRGPTDPGHGEPRSGGEESPDVSGRAATPYLGGRQTRAGDPTRSPSSPSMARGETASPSPRPVRGRAADRGVGAHDGGARAELPLGRPTQQGPCEGRARERLLETAAGGARPVGSGRPLGRDRWVRSPERGPREATVEYREGRAGAGVAVTPSLAVGSAAEEGAEGQRTPDAWRAIRDSAHWSTGLGSPSA